MADNEKRLDTSKIDGWQDRIATLYQEISEETDSIPGFWDEGGHSLHKEWPPEVSELTLTLQRLRKARVFLERARRNREEHTKEEKSIFIDHPDEKDLDIIPIADYEP